MKMIISAAIAAAIAGIWWCIITFIAFAITKSGGTGEWINEFKPYVLAFIFTICFFSVWVNIVAATATQKQTLRSRYR